MLESGLFISFEGSEGVGKTTQIGLLESWFSERDKEVILTREPGGSEVSEHIRNLVLDKNLPSMHSDTESLLIYAARAEHVEKVIKPALAQGKVVISDRFADASFAYQGYGRGIDLDRLTKLHDWVLGGFAPDLTFVLDMPVDLGMRRAEARAELDRFEQEKLSFFERVREGYLRIASADPQRVKIIDANQSIESVASDIRSVLEARCL